MEPEEDPTQECPITFITEAVEVLLQELETGQHMLDQMHATAALGHPHPTTDRHLWSHDTSGDWWECLVLGQWGNQPWVQNFRMRRGTFHDLCTWLAPVLRRQDTRLHPAIPMEKKVAIALWKLATLDSYHSVANQFGVVRSTISAVVRQVVHAINDVLLQRVICPRDVDTTIASFTSLGFLNCGGAVDGTNIPIRAPEHRTARFINQKGYCSVVLQVLVDH